MASVCRFTTTMLALAAGVWVIMLPGAAGQEPKPVADLAGRLDKLLTSQMQALEIPLPEAARKRASTVAQGLLKEVGKEQQALAGSPCADAFLTSICLTSLAASLDQDDAIKAAGKTRLIEAVRQKATDLHAKNKQAFLDSRICAVVETSMLHDLTDYLHAFRCGQRLGALGCAASHLQSSYERLMQSLHSQPRIVEFRGAIWGLIPADLADDLQIELQWAAVSHVPTYRQSRLLIDRGQGVFAITNLPPGEYRLLFRRPQAPRNLQQAVSVGDRCVFLSDLNLRNLLGTTPAAGKEVQQQADPGAPQPPGEPPAVLGPANGKEGIPPPAAVDGKDGKARQP